MPSFQLVALDPAQFTPLFAQSDTELKAQGIVRKFASGHPGFPCRVSLEDAAIGDELLLLPHWHHQVDSPYQALGPIYIRKGASVAQLPPDFVPAYATRRVISVRAYDHAHMLVAAEVCPGTSTAEVIISLFGERDVAYIHLHNAKQGCFSCLVNRAETA